MVDWLVSKLRPAGHGNSLRAPGRGSAPWPIREVCRRDGSAGDRRSRVRGQWIQPAGDGVETRFPDILRRRAPGSPPMGDDNRAWLADQERVIRGGGSSGDGDHCATRPETGQATGWLGRGTSRRWMRMTLIGSSSLRARPLARTGARGSFLSDSRPLEMDSHISQGCWPSKVMAMPARKPSIWEYSTSIFIHAIPCNTPQCPPPRWKRAPKTRTRRRNRTSEFSTWWAWESTVN